jgi:hypothetical protein
MGGGFEHMHSVNNPNKVLDISFKICLYTEHNISLTDIISH